MQLAVTGRRSEKRTDRTRPVTTGQAWTVHVRSYHCHDRTRSSVWSNVLHLASGRSPVSSHRDWTRPIARDWTRRAFGRLYDQFCPSGYLTGRSGSVRDRARRLETLTLAHLTTAENWPDASGQTATVSGAASGHHSDRRSPPFLFRLPAQ
jgi:hypothetical protein